MPSSTRTFLTWVASENWLLCSWVWSLLGAGKVDDDDVVDNGCWDPDYEVEWEVGPKGSAESRKARSISFLTHQWMNEINQKTHQWSAKGIMYVIHCLSEVMQLDAHLSTLSSLSLQPTKDDRMSNFPFQVAWRSHHQCLPYPQGPMLVRRSPSNIITTVLLEQEGSVTVRSGGTSGTGRRDRGWRRRLVLSPMLSVLVLFGAVNWPSNRTCPF